MDAKTFIKNAAKFSITPIVSTLIAIITIPFISRIYPADEYGYISNFYSLGYLLMYMFLLGLDGAYARFYYEPMNAVNNAQRCIFSISVGVGITIIVGLTVFILCPEEISTLIFNDCETNGLLLLFVYVASLIIFTILNTSARFDEDVKSYNIQQVMLLLSTRLIFVVAALFSTRYIYSVAVMTACTVLMIIFISLKNKDKIMNSPFIPLNETKKLLIFALPIMPTTVFVQLNNSVAKLILGSFDYRNEVGMLALATSVANVFSIVPKIFTTYWGAFIYKYYKTEHQLIKNIHNTIMIISMLLVVAILILQDLFFLIVGDSYKSSQKYFMLIMLAPIAVLIAETTNYGVTISKKPVYNLLISIIVCSINAVFCYLLIPILGELGAVIGIASAAITNGTLRTIAGQYFYPVVSKPYNTVMMSILIILICIANLFIWNSLALRFIIGFCCVIICIIIYNNDISRIYHIFSEK